MKHQNLMESRSEMFISTFKVRVWKMVMIWREKNTNSSLLLVFAFAADALKEFNSSLILFSLVSRWKQIFA